MGLIYLLSGLVLGAAAVRRIPFALYPFEAVAMGVVIGFFTWTWAVLLTLLVLPYDVAMPLVVTASFIAALVLWPGGSTPTWRPLEGGRSAWWLWGAATAITTVVLARLFYTHSLLQDAQGIWSAGASWADYGLHTAILSHIAAATSLPGDLPIASGEKITYPFLIDLQSAMYVQGGMGLHASLFWPGVLFGVSIVQLLMSFGQRLFQRISVTISGLAFTFLLGSWAGVSTAWHEWRDSGKGLFAFLGKLPADYSQAPKHNANVTNFVADQLLPQRAFLFGFGVGLVALIFMHTAREQRSTRLLWVPAVLIGLLPMAHPHSFMAMVAVFVFLILEEAWRTKAAPWSFLKPFGLLLLIALPQLLWQQLANGTGTGGRFRFGWMWQHGTSLPGFYWANFGLLIIAFFAIPIIMRKDRRIIWFLPMLALFVIANVYAFQPFEYDNLKLITWVYIIGGFFLMYLLSELVRRHKAWLALIIPVGFLVFIPGTLAITREFQLHDSFASQPDQQLADWISKNTPPDAVFATTDMPNNPVSSLAGRTVVMGYTGWLYNYSLPYDARRAAITAGFAGHLDDPGLKKYGADYLVVSNYQDPASWPVDQNALGAIQPAYENATWKVYKLPGTP